LIDDLVCPAFVPRANEKRCETLSNVEQSKRLLRARFRPTLQASGLGVRALNKAEVGGSNDQRHRETPGALAKR
jgi:hypothetical protein